MKPTTRRYRTLCRLLRVAGYLSVPEVVYLFGVSPRTAKGMLTTYWSRHPHAAQREQHRLANKARGGWY